MTDAQGGVPAAMVTHRDFMMVRAALVRELGGANEALVWTRIDFRLQADRPPLIDEDSVPWWPASRDTIADETGLSPDQVKRAIERLIKDGFLDSTEHRVGGNYDRTKSYRTLVQDRPVDWAESPNETGRNRPMEWAESPNVPLVEELEEQVQETRKRACRIPEPFLVKPEMWAWAAERCPDIDARLSTERFVNHWRAQSRNATKLDWSATWRNWLLNDQERAAGRAPKSKATPTDRALDAMGQMLGTPQSSITALPMREISV